MNKKYFRIFVQTTLSLWIGLILYSIPEYKIYGALLIAGTFSGGFVALINMIKTILDSCPEE